MTMTARVPAPMYTTSPLQSDSLGVTADAYPGLRAENARTPCLRARDRHVVFVPMDERERRIAENEAFWRQLNELSPPEPGMLNAVFCECGRLECSERVPMTAAEYDAVRSARRPSSLSPGMSRPSWSASSRRTSGSGSSRR